ncbi:hypothetical protein niasHT_035076 [Heterodera trifolii]|uniref:Homeobox domain-containing protein n=1 Tax=Heterodera trifolii TaxID=157864 RepID=A0ABD2IQV4_9BILA
MCFQLPPELLSELANAFFFSIFVAKRQQKILKIVYLKVHQSHEQRKEPKNIRLANFRNEISLTMSNVPIHEAVVAAHALISVHTSNFNELYVFLESHKFARQIHPKLQKICHLSYLEEYKVREKHPLPPTIWEKNSVFKENEMILITEYFAISQYLALPEKWELAAATGLPPTLIASWFKNLRSRHKKAERVKKMLSHAKKPPAKLEEKDEDDLFDEMSPFTNLFLLN